MDIKPLKWKKSKRPHYGHIWDAKTPLIDEFRITSLEEEGEKPMYMLYISGAFLRQFDTAKSFKSLPAAMNFAAAVHVKACEKVLEAILE
jgi:hypothetical protein